VVQRSRLWRLMRRRLRGTVLPALYNPPSSSECLCWHMRTAIAQSARPSPGLPHSLSPNPRSVARMGCEFGGLRHKQIHGGETRSRHCMVAVGMLRENCRRRSSIAEGRLRIWAQSRRRHRRRWRLWLHCCSAGMQVCEAGPRTVGVVRVERDVVRKWTRDLVVVDRT
jgi:hypothetical protein